MIRTITLSVSANSSGQQQWVVELFKVTEGDYLWNILVQDPTDPERPKFESKEYLEDPAATSKYSSLDFTAIFAHLHEVAQHFASEKQRAVEFYQAAESVRFFGKHHPAADQFSRPSLQDSLSRLDVRLGSL